MNIENIRPYDRMLLVGCTVNGDIITWKYKSGPIDNVVVSFVQLFYRKQYDEMVT